MTNEMAEPRRPAGDPVGPGTQALITGLGSAVPPTRVDQHQLWAQRLGHLHDDEGAAARIWQATAVQTRYVAVDPFSETPSDWTPTARMSRYLEEATALAVSSARSALTQSGLQPSDIGLLGLASSTVPFTQAPGLEFLVAEELGLPRTARRLRLGPIGCHAALPLLAVGTDFISSQARPALLIAVEVSSLLSAPHGAIDTRALVGHALFADAAGAVLMEPAPAATSSLAGLRVVDNLTVTLGEHADLLTWNPEDSYAGLEMSLSPRLPVMLGRHLAPGLTDFLAPHGLTVADIDHWAVHPGGPDVLKVVTRALHLDPDALQASYDVLAEFGNCSSATVLLVLQQLQEAHALAHGQHAVALAFGPGVTMAATLLAPE